MARGWHYTKLSLSSALLLSFSGLCFIIPFFLSFLSCFCFVLFSCSHWSFVEVPLIFSRPADHVPDWQPRILLGMVEARSVNMKNAHTHTLCTMISAALLSCSVSSTNEFPRIK